MTSSFSSSTMMVTREEFNAFHKIDRILFTRLFIGLNRDKNESFQVIGFLLFLEQHGYVRNLVSNLISKPDSYVEAVANQINVCLSLLHHNISCNDDHDQLFIPLIKLLTDGKLTLRSIHENREAFRLTLRKNLSEICYRAFEDICVNAERYREERKLALEKEKAMEETKKIKLSVPQENPNRLSVQQEREETKKTETVTEEAAEKEEATVTEDDRTVFLTFSKGYPVSEEEVRVFFSKKFGEVIEAIKMQEVKENVQPLYAKMVLQMKCVSKIEDIVGKGKNNRFIIDGKHVVARKYVSKNPNFSASSSGV